VPTPGKYPAGVHGEGRGMGKAGENEKV